MMTFAWIVFAVSVVVCAITIGCAVATRPRQALTVVGTHPVGPPESLAPLEASLLVNLPRRAIAASTMELIRLGYIRADTESGPTRHRLHRMDAPKAGSRRSFIDTLFTADDSERNVIDLRPKDRDRQPRFRSSVGLLARRMARDGLLRTSWLRTALDRMIWVVQAVAWALVLTGIAADPPIPVAATVLGVISSVFLLIMLAVRRRVGWFLTPAGHEAATQVLAFRDHLRRDPGARTRWPEWVVLFTDDVPSLIPPPRESPPLDEEWVRTLIRLLDLGPDPDLTAINGTGN